MRVSNFLLWQISYSELYVTPVLWPEFKAQDLHAGIQEYARRVRRFGAVVLMADSSSWTSARLQGR